MIINFAEMTENNFDRLKQKMFPVGRLSMEIKRRSFCNVFG
jgi:hypothetical protein